MGCEDERYMELIHEYFQLVAFGVIFIERFGSLFIKFHYFRIELRHMFYEDF
jgi:hypothetical protein